MNPYDYLVTELIPQRPPMVMIDKLLSVEAETATGVLNVQEDNLFTYKGRFQEAGLVEFMAQTAAAQTGFRNLQGREKVREGYIGALKNLVVHELPPVPSTLHAEIRIENEIVGYTILSAKVRLGSKVLATCEMRILTQN